MRNKFALCWVILLIASPFARAQKLWDITPCPDDIAAVAGDTSIAHLTAILTNTDLRSGSVPLEFVSAGEILAHNAGEAWGNAKVESENANCECSQFDFLLPQFDLCLGRATAKVDGQSRTAASSARSSHLTFRIPTAGPSVICRL